MQRYIIFMLNVYMHDPHASMDYVLPDEGINADCPIRGDGCILA
jgi:hypothetical protein